MSGLLSTSRQSLGPLTYHGDNFSLLPLPFSLFREVLFLWPYSTWFQSLFYLKMVVVLFCLHRECAKMIPERILKCFLVRLKSFDEWSGHKPCEFHGMSCPHLSPGSHNKQISPWKILELLGFGLPRWSTPLIFGKLTLTHTQTYAIRIFLTHKALSWPIKTQIFPAWSD